MPRHTVACGVLLVVILLGAMPHPAGARQEVPAATPTATSSGPEAAAVFYSQLEAAGNFTGLYQWMHPDAKQFIPASAVVGWYLNDFAPRGPGVATVTGVQMISWTWEVTGATYPNTAEVSFQQPFADGTILTDVVRLVESDGAWRWFFGRNRAFVDGQIAAYPSAPDDTATTCAGAGVWWATTYPRASLPAYLASSFQDLWSDAAVSGAVLASYVDTLSRLAAEQAALTPPPAAVPVQDGLLAVLTAYQTALADLATAQSAQVDQAARDAARASGLASIDDAAADFDAYATTAETFTTTCQPLVLFVFGEYDSPPVGVLPGQVGPGVPVVRCELFKSAAEAQRFYAAAGPGDPHGLDPDGNGIACENVSPVGMAPTVVRA